jgi:hypothetical protein
LLGTPFEQVVIFSFLELDMQYMLMFKETAADFAQRDNPETAQTYWGAWNAYVGAVAQAGIVVHGGVLPPDTATHVRLREGKRQIHDGPYADTKEHLGGYYIIEVPSLDDAIAWAARCPCAANGSTEVRLVVQPPAQ